MKETQVMERVTQIEKKVDDGFLELKTTLSRIEGFLLGDKYNKNGLSAKVDDHEDRIKVIEKNEQDRQEEKVVIERTKTWFNRFDAWGLLLSAITAVFGVGSITSIILFIIKVYEFFTIK